MSTRKRDVKDGKTEDVTRQPEQVKAFRDTWELGIHSYLSYLRDRLVTARELLTESGSIFVQIGDENVHLVRSLLDEVLGSENWCGNIHVIKTAGQTDLLLAAVSDTLLWYAKSKEQVKYRGLYQEKGVGYGEIGQYYYAEFETGERRRLADEEIENAQSLPKSAHPFRISDLSSNKFYSLGRVPFEFQGETYLPPAGRHWTHSPEGRERLKYANRIYAVGNSVRFTGFLDDFPFVEINNQWSDTGISGFASEKIYVVQTNTKVIERCLLMTTDPGDLVLDPTCGSGTTAYVAEQWGRRWITIDTSRVAIALARTRLMAAKYPYYLLADSPEGAKKEMEIGSRDSAQRPFGVSRAFGTTEVVTTSGTTSGTTGDIRRGFVYKRVPHVTLKAIANNEELDAIHARWQAQLDPLRAKINKLAKQTWEEWEIPREAPPEINNQKSTISNLLAEWWQVRRERQSEIDASIAKRADTELLYDQPYEDNKRIRVTGPFTVESLSPHRVLSTDETDELPTSEKAKDDSSRHYSFETMIVENLKKAGVQNTVKQERLKFDRLEPYAGVWVNAVGEYTEAPHPGPLPKGEGVVRRVAVSIGSEHGTVGPEQVQEAAKEAVQGIGFDLLIVCGFAFDPHVSLESMRYGKLQVLIARMNPDLSLGDEVLKKTGAGNLFMVFGEPDMEIKRSDDLSRYYVELKGVDVYDPTTGAIRSHTTDEIACWFIDTAYDGESFFVRQAYFTGAGDPYDRLKRALRAEIDEEAWAALYTTKSYPFDAPPGKKGKPGKIAVKVINHYGDEVLKVCEVG